ncbi:hypothetical protein Cgig2_005508 [Carnegiea gigantea]|uniref:Uncharacterized protein n=1 Tax=Carnegiea gigantea TaxID=171969 RepID=A0A9Q1JK85_9CARY|nr:hypothetical protein Cgig2_005508 [Carnegiea gigantea]
MNGRLTLSKPPSVPSAMNEPPDPLPFFSHLPSRPPLLSLIASSVRVNLLFPWNSFACATFRTRLYACLYSDLPLGFRISLLFHAARVVSSIGGVAVIIASIVGHDPKPWPRTRLVVTQVPGGKIHLTSPFPAMIITDRVILREDCLKLFPDYCVTNGPFTYSDHSYHHDTHCIVKRNGQFSLPGTPMYCITQKLKKIKLDLKTWSKSTFGNFRHKLERNAAKLLHAEQKLVTQPNRPRLNNWH